MIFLNNFFAKGAATGLPGPPGATDILPAFHVLLYGPNAIYNA